MDGYYFLLFVYIDEWVFFSCIFSVFAVNNTSCPWCSIFLASVPWGSLALAITYSPYDEVPWDPLSSGQTLHMDSK